MNRLKQRFVALDLCPLPVELVNAILGCTLTPGMVHFTAANQEHAHDRHGPEYLACCPYIALTVADPHFIGQSPKHPGEFEMVRAVGDIAAIGGNVLVALTLALDENRAWYGVQSVYPIGHGTVQRRLRKEHLFRVDRG